MSVAGDGVLSAVLWRNRHLGQRRLCAQLRGPHRHRDPFSRYGFWAPKGTPKDVIAKLNAAARDALADPEFRKCMEAQSATFPTPEQQTPEWLGKYQAKEVEKWWPLIKSANIKAQ
jgi:hypothetical protein